VTGLSLSVGLSSAADDSQGKLVVIYVHDKTE
jgi:hypothetical protein